MPRTTHTAYFARFLADQHSVVQDGGHQIDFDQVGAGYLNATTGKKEIPAGTIMAPDTTAGDGYIIPRADSGATTATCILLTDAVEDERHAARTGYGVILGGSILEDLLPDSEDASFATWQGELTAVGVGNFVWVAGAEDSSAA